MKRLKKYRYYGIALLSSVVFALYFSAVFSSNHKPLIKAFQQQFSQKEKELNRFLDLKKDELKHNQDFATWSNYTEENQFYLHVFKNDSLIFWNTNQLPVLSFADIHFPSEGIIHLQNGWYYSNMFEADGHKVCASFLIKHDYPYENKDLKNELSESFYIPFEGSISLEKIDNYNVSSLSNSFLFSFVPDDLQVANENESVVLSLLFLLSLCAWLFAIHRSIKRSSPYLGIVFVVLIIGLRFLSLRLEFFNFMKDTRIYQPDLYASNSYFPNFFEYLINVIVICYILIALTTFIQSLRTTKLTRYIGYIALLLNFPLWYMLLVFTNGLIENSSIPLDIEQLFSLNAYSILAIVSLGALYFCIHQFVLAGFRLHYKNKMGISTLAVGIFILGFSFFIIEITMGNQLLFGGLFPLVFLALLSYQVFRQDIKNNIGFSILFLFLFCATLANNFSELSDRKERQDRELFANQIATEKDIVTEIEFNNLSQQLQDDAFLLKFLTLDRKMSVSDFEDAMERRFFNGYWERYEMNFNLFDVNGSSLIVDDNQNFTSSDIDHLISEHGSISEIDTSIIFIKDYTDQYSYIIRLPLIANDSLNKGIFVATLKSKKIPEEIGFPRLLISSGANVIESLEDYSIAKYHDGRLITKYGIFTYPSNDNLVREWRKNSGFQDKGGYNHYILHKSENDIIVLSSKNHSSIELITSFSYLFCFFGILLLPLFFKSSNTTPFFKRTFSLAIKIQFVLIGLVFVSLLGFGWGSGIFVRNQYNDYTHQMIREKLNSVDKEIKSKIGTKKYLDIQRDGNYLEYILRKFSKVFVTDINLYDKKGQLIACSRPKVFNMGLISEQMNPTAFYTMKIENKSEFIHQENIGDLDYSSAYLPSYNIEGELLGYMNLQHFGQQKEFENQIQNFLVAIINVFMLLLAVSIILAIFISNWVTAPLRLLQQSFAGVKFGKHNQQINYTKDDEIGALVKDYNQKLDELEFAAQQLAQNERESAWREMAKQVAHEIKNPLTPMKLSIQQLQRVYDPSNPDSGAKLTKVANSLVEQIDALTKIANEFSNFAKMPKPNEEQMDLLPLIERVIEVSHSEQECEITLVSQPKNAEIVADKDQILRVFNNLIKNAQQAIPEDKIGKISIDIRENENSFIIQVMDNGVGIPVDQQSKIFVPYFTTKSTGTGLGLAMVRQIIENHNGTIDFSTSEDKGTTFTITLPKAKK
jgi:two-component system, NtrC family, nitrogen regulation sensor histidine kinase NtrY